VAAASKKPVGKDFDFFGQTAKVSDAINEEQLRFTRQQPPSKVTPAAQPGHSFPQPAAKPSRTGYERYNEPGYVPEMQVDADIWGTGPKRAHAQESPGLASSLGRKMMSLEEVEAAMRAQAKKPTQVQSQQQYSTPPQQPQQYSQPPPQHFQQNFPQQHHQQYPAQGTSQPPLTERRSQEERRPAQAGHQPQPVQILQRAPNPTASGAQGDAPTVILQNPNRHPGVQELGGSRPNVAGSGHRSRPSNSRPIITHPNQLADLSEEDRSKFLADDAKRAKRNHKIFLMSKDNGLMTPQDKNFITRIQLQQLVTATGNPNEHGMDSGLSEDFYYQVHNQIRGGPRQHPGQPLSNFAQTYLYQTGGRHGGMRRQARGGDNHMQRMEQQVQRAVEAAKNKPKNKQLVIEGSLGKISFSNAKTPKPLLNFKRTENDRKTPGVTGSDRKTVLTDIENVYSTLMEMEDHERHLPPPLHDDVDPELVGRHMDWREKADKLNAKLWQQLKVHEPIGATEIHPFIAYLSFSKGKKSIQRVFRHITHEQRTTILTMIVVHLDQLDVVRQAQLLSGETLLNARIRENVELFSSAVLPSLFSYLGEAPLDIITGVLGLVLSINVDIIARTRVGVSLLTMVLSRAELLKQGGDVNEQEWAQW